MANEKDTDIKDPKSKNPDSGTKKETVSKEAYDQMKADMHRFKTQSKERESDLTKMNEKLETIETQSLEKQKNYKELWEASQKREKDAKDEAKNTRDSYLEDRKLSEIEKEALSQGMDVKSVKLLRSGAFDTESVVTETTSTGRINVLGAKEFVEDLKKDWGDQFFSKGKAPNINTKTPRDGDPNLQDKKLSGIELVALQKKDPEAYEKAMNARLGRG